MVFGYMDFKTRTRIITTRVKLVLNKMQIIYNQTLQYPNQTQNDTFGYLNAWET